jgi:hypothetical protein
MQPEQLGINNGTPEQEKNSPITARKPIPKKAFLIVGGVFILLLVVLLGVFFSPNEQVTEKATETAAEPTASFDEIKKTAENSPNAKASSHKVVYGTWTGQSSLIKSVEVASGETQLLATLPMAIKKITVLDAKTLLFIDQVDKRDHGRQIAIYDVSQKKITATIPAAEGFGIDEYTLSPDKKYLALWEVGFAQGSEILQGGKSRVYAVNLANPTIKNLLYDETATKPVHYPRAILDNGTVFADKFMPNDPNGGAGWAYGMSMASFDGSTKKELDMMKAGSYATQPQLSEDGKYLLFAGYDGKYGDGNKVKNGLRQAILTPNTVDILNTQTLQRYKLGNLPNNDSYPTAAWDYASGKIIVSVVGATPARTGLYSYDLSSKELQKISIPAVNNMEYIPVAGITGNQMLVGSFEENASNLGNLGANYEYAYNRLASYDMQSGKAQQISIQDAYAQYITTLPSNYFSGVLGIKTLAQANPQPTFVDQFSNQNDSKQNLQLYTFFLKYDLQPIRQKQQSTPVSTPQITPNLSVSRTPNVSTPRRDDDNMPKCNDVTAKVCAEKGQGPGTKDYVKCKGQYKAQNMERTCDDSPLYLYGMPGQHVKVTINTSVYNAIPSYNNGYNVTLLVDGKMRIGGKSYERISYDYSSNLRVRKAPQYGTIVNKEDVEKTLRYYATNLGLNEKETNDLVRAGKQKVTSPYVFVSFYDHETSHRILPISFSPEPDNYLNVVFYFKLLETKPSYSPVPPTFGEPVKRTGFTAVEVSEVVE